MLPVAGADFLLPRLLQVLRLCIKLVLIDRYLVRRLQVLRRLLGSWNTGASPSLVFKQASYILSPPYTTEQKVRGGIWFNLFRHVRLNNYWL